MIDVVNVSKSYGPIRAVHAVSFHVKPGEIIGLLGPNGSGKTTLMRILTGYLQPDEGQVSVDGLDVLTNTLQVQRRIGYLAENAPLYPELTTQEYLKMIADLRRIPESEQPARLSEAIRATGLHDHLTRPIGELSKGYRQRVGLAQAIVHKPKVLILDEPTVGLDPTQIAEVRRLIRRLAGHSTVLLCTHVLSEVEATCERVIMLLNGEVRADARLADLAETSDVMLILGPGGPDASSDLKALPGVKMVESHPTADGAEYWISGVGEKDLRPEVYQLAREEGWPVKELRRDVRTLETVFNELAVSDVESPREESKA
ncbi:MAG TPA: ABC transporter ATP-binding protein [Anaerolineae bacterium]|jgi:ABC-2 type transport system ATP-binding protein|nr:ABC transporter ATP-binding protein [Anaerolineae bacterium]